MKKSFLAAALALGLCVPAYAAQYTNSEDDRYTSPTFADEETTAAPNKSVEPKKSKKMAKEAGEPVPINMTAEHAQYDSTSGDFHATGNVVIVQGTEKLLTTEAVGNM